MTQSITISEPTIPPKQPLGQYIFAMVFLIGLGMLSLFLASFPEMGLSGRIGFICLALLVFATAGYSIVVRKKYGKKLITFDSAGITFKNDTSTQTIGWQEIEQISLTYAFYATEQQGHEAYPFMLFSTTQQSHLPQKLSVQRKNKQSIHFVATPEDFPGFIGNFERYAFAINAEHFPDLDGIAFFAQFGKNVSTSRPMMQVKTNREYNELLKKTYSEERVSEYILSEDGTSLA